MATNRNRFSAIFPSLKAYSKSRFKTPFPMIVFFFLHLLLSQAFAQAPSAEKKESQKQDKGATPSAQTAARDQKEAKSFDLILILDSSGSMKKTDPENYRKPAARLMVSLLGEEDRIGIIRFGESTKTLIPLTQNSKENRNQFLKAIGQISSSDLFTNIYEGVEKGFEELKASQRKNRILLLMSDGKIDLGSKEKDETSSAELSKLLPELAKSNIQLYSVAFTEMSDIPLLEDMAKQTGGFFRLAKTDKDIHMIFTSMFEKMKSPNAIPFEGDTFNIDKDINEAILLITKKPGTATTLIEPSGTTHTPTKYSKNMQWFESKVFDMITIKTPAVGRWKAKLSSTEGNKVFVITNLNLKTSFNQSFVDEGKKIKVDVWLEKEGGRLTEKEVLEQISFAAEVTAPDGTLSKVPLADMGISGDEKAGDGIYSNEMEISRIGEYTIKLMAEGKTFKREQVIQLKAVTKPPEPPKPEQPLPAVTTPVPKAPPAKTEPEEPPISWKKVWVPLVVINLVLIIVVAGILLSKKLILKKGKNISQK